MIDDDKDLCRLIKNNLEREGYKVSLQHRGDFLLPEVLCQPYQLIILGLMLPSKNGYEVLSEIRKTSHVPILMLTAMDNEGDKISCLRMGADDYLTKPFSASELSARVASRRLRKKIKDIPESPAYLLTVWGAGYKMNGAPEKCWPYSLSSYPGSACCSFSIYTPSTENSKNSSPLAPYFPWTATYLLITGRIGNASLAAHLILAALCLSSISASIHYFQKADIP